MAGGRGGAVTVPWGVVETVECLMVPGALPKALVMKVDRGWPLPGPQRETTGSHTHAHAHAHTHTHTRTHTQTHTHIQSVTQTHSQTLALNVVLPDKGGHWAPRKEMWHKSPVGVLTPACTTEGLIQPAAVTNWAGPRLEIPLPTDFNITPSQHQASLFLLISNGNGRLYGKMSRDKI